MPTIKSLQESLAAELAFLNSDIGKEDALAHVNYYRQSLPPGAVKSVWFDNGIINFIIKNAADLKINGMRIYLAKYDGVHKPTSATKDKLTAIVVPTMPGSGGTIDVPFGYYNYGSPCPPEKCNEDEGNH